VFIIFTLYMIPDPATTQVDPRRQTLFGFSVAIVVIYISGTKSVPNRPARPTPCKMKPPTQAATKGKRPVNSAWTMMPDAERDHLRSVVFPALQERLRARRHHLEPIDLRWGWTDTPNDSRLKRYCSRGAGHFKSSTLRVSLRSSNGNHILEGGHHEIRA